MVHYPKNTKCYSPKGVRDLFDQAIKNENDNIANVLKKREYQRLRELWYASFFALALKKCSKKEYYLSEPNSDSPDVLLLDIVNNQGFGLEIMELYFHNQAAFDGDYKKLAQTIWDKKWLKDLRDSHLLVVSRIAEKNFNVTKLIEDIQKFDRKSIERLWFSTYRGFDLRWTFFDIYPPIQFSDKRNISFSVKDKQDMKFWY